MNKSKSGLQLLDDGFFHVGLTRLKECLVPESPLAFSLFSCGAVGLELLDMLIKCIVSSRC